IIPLGGAPSTMSLVAGDFQSDGHTDLAVASIDFSNGHSLTVLQGDGTGNFPTSVVTPIGVCPAAVVAADFNGDGHLDLATADVFVNGIDDNSVFLGNNDGTFADPTSYGFGGPGASTAIVTGDFAHTGRDDLAIAQTSPDQVYVRLSNGDGTFTDPGVNLAHPETPL